MSSEILNALAALQEAEAKLVNAMSKIEGHNIDEEAHPAIRQMFKEITDGDTMYTRQQIRDMINELIKAHTSLAYDEAHSGWNEYETQLLNRLAKLDSKIESLENRINGQVAEDSKTQLARVLQAIEDKYAPILENLQECLQTAQDNRQETLAEEYKNAIGRTLDEKKTEMLKTITLWMGGEEKEEPVVPEKPVIPEDEEPEEEEPTSPEDDEPKEEEPAAPEEDNEDEK